MWVPFCPSPGNEAHNYLFWGPFVWGGCGWEPKSVGWKSLFVLFLSPSQGCTRSQQRSRHRHFCESSCRMPCWAAMLPRSRCANERPQIWQGLLSPTEQKPWQVLTAKILPWSCDWNRHIQEFRGPLAPKSPKSLKRSSKKVSKSPKGPEKDSKRCQNQCQDTFSTLL